MFHVETGHVSFQSLRCGRIEEMPYFGSVNGNRNEDSDLICAGLELPTETSSQNGVALLIARNDAVERTSRRR